MKHLKRVFQTVVLGLLITVVGIAASSCSEDEEENGVSSIYAGTWKPVHSKGWCFGGRQEWDTDNVAESYAYLNSTIVLNSNGTGRDIGDENDTWTWKVEENYMIFDGYQFAKIVSCDGATLILERSSNDDGGCWEQTTYAKIK